MDAVLFIATNHENACAYLTETRPGQTIAIPGIGGLRQMAVQYAKAMGLDVIAADVAEDKLELAKSLRAGESRRNVWLGRYGGIILNSERPNMGIGAE